MHPSSTYSDGVGRELAQNIARATSNLALSPRYFAFVEDSLELDTGRETAQPVEAATIFDAARGTIRWLGYACDVRRASFWSRGIVAAIRGGIR